MRVAVLKQPFLGLGYVFFDSVKSIWTTKTCSFIISIICTHWHPRVASLTQFFSKNRYFFTIFDDFDWISEAMFLQFSTFHQNQNIYVPVTNLANLQAKWVIFRHSAATRTWYEKWGISLAYISAHCAHSENLIVFKSVMEILLLVFSKSLYYGGINAKDRN